MGIFGPPNVERMSARKDVYGLISVLSYWDDVRLRKAAAKSLGEIGDPRAVKPLIVSLDNDPDNWETSKALAKIGEPALRPLIVALKDKNREWIGQGRSEIVRVLVNLRDPRAIEPIITVLKDKNEDLRGAAAHALGEFGDSRAVGPLIAIVKLKRRGWSVWSVAEALGKIGDSRAIEPLVAVLADRDKGLRGAAAQALKQLGWKPGKGEVGAWYWVALYNWEKAYSYGSLAVEPLIDVLNSNMEVSLRKSAVETLGKIGDPRAVKPLTAALKDKESEVRWAAVWALGDIGEPAVKPYVTVLLEILKGSRTIGTSIYDQHGALDKIVQIGTAAVEPLLEVLGSDKDEVARWVSAEALGRIGDRKAVETLINVLKNDRHPDVRWHAAEALGSLADDRALEVLADASKDKDKWVRDYAKEAFEKIKELY